MDELASLSSSIPNPWTYHVFLSFRGKDTRYGFTNNLHRALERNRICSFMDDENIVMGEEIDPAVAKAIEQSMTAIIVFSENYAQSTSCLEELVKIIDCIKRNGRKVFPIFYKVHPSNIKNQTGSYKLAFDEHEERFGSKSEKLRNWKSALYEAASLKGKYFNENEYEHNFIEWIVRQVSRKINDKASHSSANYPVELKEQMVHTFDSIADVNDDKQTWKLAVRITSLWEAMESQSKTIVRSLNMILYDEQLGKIQASVKKKLLPRFKQLREGECYVMQNFEVAENKQKSCSEHKFLLYFQKTTVIEPCRPLNIPRWNWVPLQNVLNAHVAHGCFIDVFGEVVYIDHAETYKTKLEFDLQDDSKGRISCTVRGKLAEQLSSAYKSSPRSPLIIAWHQAKINLFEGDLHLTNSSYSSKLFINPDMEEVFEFRNRRNSMELSSLETFSQLSTQQTFSNENEWLSFGQIKTISEIKETKEVRECITVATIKMIEIVNPWYYCACQTCSKKIDIEGGKATYNCNCKRPITCVPKYRIQVQVEDHTKARASFILFDPEGVKLINCPAANLIKSVTKEKPPDNQFPDSLNVMLGKRLLFKVKISEYNLEHNYSTFTVKNITDDEQIIESYIRSSKSTQEQNSTALGSINNEAQSSKNVYTAENACDAPMKRHLLESEGDDDENIPPEMSYAKKYKRIKSKWSTK